MYGAEHVAKRRPRERTIVDWGDNSIFAKKRRRGLGTVPIRGKMREATGQGEGGFI